MRGAHIGAAARGTAQPLVQSRPPSCPLCRLISQSRPPSYNPMSRFAVTSDWVGNAIVSNQQQTSALAEKVAVPKRQPSAEDPTTVLGGPKGYHHSAQPSMGDDCSSSSDTVPSEAALQLAPPVCTAAATGPIIRSDSSFSSTTSSVRSAGEPSSSNSEAAAPLGKDTHYSR